MRSYEEIAEKLLTPNPEDMFGSIRELLATALPYKEAMATGVLNETLTEEEWAEVFRDEAGLLNDAFKYLEFAAGKAENHRGLSANRSVQKYDTWVWLLAPEEEYNRLQTIQHTQYAQYGVPVLAAAAGMLGLKEEWTRVLTPALTRMGDGLVCESGCDAGCNR